MNAPAPPQRYCIVGAGPCGLTAAKNLAEQGISFDCLEAEEDLGGNWLYGSPHSSVYSSTHLISSKRLTEYTDFPMPRSFPPYPSHAQALSYLRAYAEQFQLSRFIEYGKKITHLTRRESGWEVRVAGEPAARAYAGVLIASGHHWDPQWPEIPGRFEGEMLHAHDYKTPDILAGKRVLVLGGGNSGCDIAVEAGRCAKEVFQSLRRGYHFLPKFLLGKPVDSCGDRLHRWRFPLWLQRRISSWMVHISLGPPERYGLPRPDHKLFETHPIVNSQLLYSVGHGLVKVRPGVERFEGREVVFTDGSRETIDLIICATGYKISFPFIQPNLLHWKQGRPDLFLNVFHPRADDLFLVGLIQPNSGIWGLADLQAQLVARFLSAMHSESSQADWFRRLKAGGNDDLSGGIRYVASARHLVEVEYFGYRRRLRKLLRRFGRLPAETPAF